MHAAEPTVAEHEARATRDDRLVLRVERIAREDEGRRVADGREVGANGPQVLAVGERDGFVDVRAGGEQLQATERGRRDHQLAAIEAREQRLRRGPLTGGCFMRIERALLSPWASQQEKTSIETARLGHRRDPTCEGHERAEIDLPSERAQLVVELRATLDPRSQRTRFFVGQIRGLDREERRFFEALTHRRHREGAGRSREIGAERGEARRERCELCVERRFVVCGIYLAARKRHDAAHEARFRVPHDDVDRQLGGVVAQHEDRGGRARRGNGAVRIEVEHGAFGPYNIPKVDRQAGRS